MAPSFPTMAHITYSTDEPVEDDVGKIREARERLDDFFDPEFPWSILVLGVATLLFYLGYISVEAGMGINGSVIAIALMSIAWTMGRFFAEANRRGERREHRAEVDHLRKENEALRRDTRQYSGSGDGVVAVAQAIVDEAKVRREDLDSDDTDFRYEVEPRLMLDLSEALEDFNARSR